MRDEDLLEEVDGFEEDSETGEGEFKKKAEEGDEEEEEEEDSWDSM